MRTELRYFTGTGNSLKVLQTCHKVFLDAGHGSVLSEIPDSETVIPGSDLFGFCFPVYAFAIPRICRKYLLELDRFPAKQRVFLLVTAGNGDEAGYAIQEGVKILKRKNCVVLIHSAEDLFRHLPGLLDTVFNDVRRFLPGRWIWRMG
jgi:hypothetical protein